MSKQQLDGDKVALILKDVIENLLEAWQPIKSVIAIYAGGSIGRGDSDDLSDIDLVAFAADGAVLETVASELSDAVASKFEIVYKNVVRGPSLLLNFIMRDWTRLDVSVVANGMAQSYTRSDLILLRGRELYEEPHQESAEPRRREADAIATEFVRVLGLLPVVIGRNELIVGVTGASILRSLLIELVSLRAQDRTPRGALRLEGLLLPGDAEAIRSLPPLQATRSSIIDAHVATAGIFIPLARALASSGGGRFPEVFWSATVSHLQNRLGTDVRLEEI